MNIRVFDLDNTLIMTDELNNRAYNHALGLFGLSPLESQKRITREYIRKIFPFLSDFMLMRIVKEKQRFFLANLHIAKLNESVVRLLKNAEKKSCVLWTKAEYGRAVSLLRYHNLFDLFAFVLVSPKEFVREDINTICQKMHCTKEDLFFWDDDAANVSALQACGIKNVCHVIAC